MHKLYTRPGSGGFVIEAALKLAGVAFEQIDVPKTPEPDPEFLKISPMHQVPVLVLPDGHAVPETAAISLLLAELHPGKGLGPVASEPGRADFLRWMAFMATAIYMANLRYYYPHRSTTDAAGIAAVKQAAVVEMDKELGILDRALAGRDWLVGDSRTIADVYMLMLVCWYPDLDKARALWPNVERVCARLRADPMLAALNGPHEMWPA
ncbi:MAG TPA: glutathione S-transferase family protein [Mesorhizobium sp.]|jgi:glutathione S-transferase|uniref:glutathione S-transferase family protein n=1 Tax=Mesorhizobium sp. TaxID=1871066 RepID=UPI002DDD6905|nr:glutathione S-transferase family protein [Mesorhizobium sp.]HEV2502913.1 glutathione S-transferase family protein [Mesorhizobium sp.]